MFKNNFYDYVLLFGDEVFVFVAFVVILLLVSSIVELLAVAA